MDLRSNCYVNCAGYPGLSHAKMSSPTCEDLGIPTDLSEEAGTGMYPILTRRVIHNPSLHLDGLRYESHAYTKGADPYSPICMIPLPGVLAIHSSAEPSFIRKRNERERERVRCVNEGYERLKEHLPMANKEKRISKVETLRGAIQYIRQLQKMLESDCPQSLTPQRLDCDTDTDSEVEEGGKTGTVVGEEAESRSRREL